MKVTAEQIQRAATSPAMAKAIAELINETMDCDQRAAMEACREPTARERRECYQHARAPIPEDEEFHHRVVAGLALKRRLAEHWARRDEAANEN